LTSFTLTVLKESVFPCKALVIEGIPGLEKTALIAGLVSWLASQGLKLAVVSFGLKFDPGDVGKDTWKFRQAGANPVALAAPGVYQITSVIKAEPEIILAQAVAALAPTADLVLVDLGDTSLATSASSTSLSAESNRGAVALVSSTPVSSPLPVFELHQVSQVGQFILDCLSG
jgi:molybdopterin-guanine dinucleotide biosynthesis protein B